MIQIEEMLLRLGGWLFLTGIIINVTNIYIVGKPGNVLAKLIGTIIGMAGLMSAMLGAIGYFLGVEIMTKVLPAGILILIIFMVAFIKIWKRDKNFLAVMSRINRNVQVNLDDRTDVLYNKDRMLIKGDKDARRI